MLRPVMLLVMVVAEIRIISPMATLFSRVKLGYYPLPLQESDRIRSLLIPRGPYCALDPCAGDGSALLEITKDTCAHLGAIEIDADRAAACTQRGIPTVHGSAFECKVQSESCSLLYLNPPFDTELGPQSNQRMELRFLEHCFRWVITEGVLVFVIPVTVLASCARLLASQFGRLSIFRLEHPASARFKQIVVFGKRKPSHSRGDPNVADALVRAGCYPNLIPALNQQVGDRYSIPPSPPVTICYMGLPLDAVEDALQHSTAMRNAGGILVRKQQKLNGRKVLPLHKGSVGLLACAGLVNGIFGEGEVRHIAHWRSVKHVDVFNEESEAEGETIIRRRERFSHELTLAYADGNIVELKETKEENQRDEKRP